MPRDIARGTVSRRRVLKLALGMGAAAAAGATGWPSASWAAFTHPGMLHTQSDLDRMASKVSAGAQPWLSGWNKLVANPHSQSTWTPSPVAVVYRGSGTPENYGKLYNDIAAAYQNALRWKVTGDTAHANCAANILNAWSGTLTKIDGTADRFLAAGIYGYEIANAAELLRGYSAFNLSRFQTIMKNVFYPLCNDFLLHHNGACITNYWANWDLCAMAAIMAIGILCDDAAKFNQAIDYFYNGAGNGSLPHLMPFQYPGQRLAQWQESGRDQGHATLGVALAGSLAEMAWHQGQDLYGASGNQLLAGFEYIARYNLGEDVPYTTYTWGTGQNCAQQSQTVISEASRGLVRPTWALVYNHYAVRKGLFAPNCAAFMKVAEAEGGGGDYGPNSGGYDSLGFGTLTAIEQANATLPTGVKRSFQSVNYPARWIATEDDSLGYLDPVDVSSTSTVKQSASFTVVSGLADARGYSLRAADGRYLRHSAFRLRLGGDDGTDLFRKDATFYAVAGSATGSVRLVSYNYPGRCIRHRDFQLWLDTYDLTGANFPADSSFNPLNAWA
jgi:Alpha-L-arabinofuranosidase B (ABFB) domain/Alginate lyase